MAGGTGGKGFWGWLGRQVGHVRKAVHAPVDGLRVVHRSKDVHEAVLPDQPGVKLRRTVIDEVIVDKKKGEK